MAKKFNLFGSWAFLIGVLLALGVGVYAGLNGETEVLSNTVLQSVLIVLGVIIGLFNIADKESSPFMTSGIVLILASFFGAQIMATIPVAIYTLGALLLIFVPATIIVAIRNVFSMAKY